MSQQMRSRWSTMLALVAVVAIPAVAAADDVPIKLRYDGTFPAPTLVTVQPLVVATTDQLTGHGTHLGRFTATYPHQINFDAGSFLGTATFRAANGDLLYVELGGGGYPTSATTYAVNFQGTITGGTGRFLGASGSLTGTGSVDLASLRVNARLEGTINKADVPWVDDL